MEQDMGEAPEPSPQSIVRVAVPGQPAFQLRKGEEGISVFDLAATDPVLTAEEVLASFRPGSQLIVRSIMDIEAKGLCLVVIGGAETLPERLRKAHREIRPGVGVTREQFKRALRELE
jgi:hypothetical protein